MESGESEKVLLVPKNEKSTDSEEKSDSKDEIISKCSKPISKSDEAEQKIWDIVQGVPALNTMYGSIRLIVYISKRNKEESLKSVKGIVKGIVQSAAIAGSVFIGPVLTPAVGVATGALTAIVTESLQGMSHVIIFIMENSKELVKEDSADGKEKLIYSQVKDLPAIGAAYSTARSPIYAAKGEDREVKVSGVHAAGGTADTAITVGLNMLPIVDTTTKGIIQAMSRSIIQLLSTKVIEDVSKEKVNLEKKSNSVENLGEKRQVKSDEDGINKNSDLESLKQKLEETKISEPETTCSDEMKLDLEREIDRQSPTTTAKSDKAFITRIANLMKSPSKSKSSSLENISDEKALSYQKGKEETTTKRDSKILIIALEDEEKCGEILQTETKSEYKPSENFPVKNHENSTVPESDLQIKSDIAVISALKKIANLLKRSESKSKLKVNDLNEHFSSEESISEGNEKETKAKRDSNILIIALEDDNSSHSSTEVLNTGESNLKLDENVVLQNQDNPEITAPVKSDAVVISTLKRIVNLLKRSESKLKANDEFSSDENVSDKNQEECKETKRDSKILIIALETGENLEAQEQEQFESEEIKSSDSCPFLEDASSISETRPTAKSEAVIMNKLKRIANIIKRKPSDKLAESSAEPSTFYLDNNDTLTTNLKGDSEKSISLNLENEKDNNSDEIIESELESKHLKDLKDQIVLKPVSNCQLPELDLPENKEKDTEAKKTLKTRISKFLKRSSINKSKLQNKVETTNFSDSEQLESDKESSTSDLATIKK